jgi:hypothetical protein
MTKFNDRPSLDTEPCRRPGCDKKSTPLPPYLALPRQSDCQDRAILTWIREWIGDRVLKLR